MTYKTTFAKKLSCRMAGSLLVALMAASTLTYAQTAAVNPVVPNIVNYNGTLADASGKLLTAISGVTFSLYKDSEGGAPLWMETQNIQPDSHGHFSAKLGSASGQGVPADLFASGEARWLGVQVQGQAEQPRVLLLSVPYALKAADAETLGGMPASAFVLSKSGNALTGAGEHEIGSSQSGHSFDQEPAAAKAVKTPSPYGVASTIPLWVGKTQIGNSIMQQVEGNYINIDGGLATTATSEFDSSDSDAGVYGSNLDPTDFSFGIAGQAFSSIGIGVAGYGTQFSNTFKNHIGFQPFGVEGDAADGNGSSLPIGVAGTADSGVAVLGENNNPTNPAALFLNNTSSDAIVLEASGSQGDCVFDTTGGMMCSGEKSAMVQLPDQRWVRLYAVESPVNWFEDFGSGTLANGSATIQLDPTFAQTVNTKTDYHVFITPNGESEGLYVANKTAGGFEVREQHGGHSNIGFDYRIVGRRLGYENVRMEDVTALHANIAAAHQQLMKTGAGKSVHLPTRALRK
jgi:hypothetical protein